MSFFDRDLYKEKILGQFLDKIYTDIGLIYERIIDVDKQNKGIDLIIKFNESYYFVDEKAHLDYINSSLPTVTFEISYLINN